MIIDELFEGPQLCPECGGISFSDLILAEKKDACYHKVKASAKVWPSAYASGRLVQCRKKGAANYGNKSEGVAEGSEPQVGDAVYYGKRLVGWFKGYSEHGKIITEPDYEEMGDEYANRDVYWDPQDKITIRPEQGVAETRRGQIPMTLKPGETDNLEPEDFAEFKKLPEYQQGYQAQQKTGKQPIQKSPYTFQSDQDWAYRQGATDAQRAAMFANFGGTKPLTTEAGDESQKLKFTVPIIPNNMPGGANLPAGGAPKWTSTKIPGVSSHTGPAPKVTQSPNINTKIDAAANVPAYIRRGLPDPVTTPVNKPKITVRPGETQSQAMQRSQTEKEFGKFLQGQSGQTFGPGAGRGNTNPAAPNWKNDQTDIDLEEASKQQKGADYRDPKEVDYDDEYDAMVARVKRLAGLGPMKTVYDPAKRQYRNMPTAVQPKK